MHRMFFKIPLGGVIVSDALDRFKKRGDIKKKKRATTNFDFEGEPSLQGNLINAVVKKFPSKQHSDAYFGKNVA